MWMVDVERGRKDGIAMSRELEEAEALESSAHLRRAGAEDGPIRMVDDEIEANGS
jgi:hypothetical protein